MGDPKGLHLLVSNPHFSEKVVTVQSAPSGTSSGPTETSETNATPGLGLVATLATAGLVAVFARRRR